MIQPPYTGLVLAGGGARGAYQAGALAAITEITSSLGIEQPFPIISGTSAGALNGVFLAAFSDNMPQAVSRLKTLWETISTDQVYSIGKIALGKLILLLRMESETKRVSGDNIHSILNTSPLRHLIEREIPFDKIKQNITHRFLHSIAIKALDYNTGSSRIFFQSMASIQPWERIGRIAEETDLTIDHVLASTSIPFLFPPVCINAHYYGDGGLRNYTPLSPPIKMGAEKLIVIGVRTKKDPPEGDHIPTSPSLGKIFGILLNTIFLDAVDLDFERLSRVNRTLRQLKPDASTPLRPIQVCMIHPSENLGQIAEEETEHLPLGISKMMRAFGRNSEVADLTSYLLFEPQYTQRLVNLGYRDVMKKAEDLICFLKNEPSS